MFVVTPDPGTGVTLGLTLWLFVSVPLQPRRGTRPLILDFYENVWGDRRVLNLKNASSLLHSTSQFLETSLSP